MAPILAAVVTTASLYLLYSRLLFAIGQVSGVSAPSLLFLYLALGSTLLYLIFKRLFNPLQRFPWAKNQKDPNASWLKNFLSEPTATDLYRYMQDSPDEPVLRYRGILNGGRLLFATSETIREACVAHCDDWGKITARSLLYPITGEGLLVAEGDVHRVQRKNMNPAFSYRHIKQLYPLFYQKALELAKLMDREILETDHHSSVPLGGDQKGHILDMSPLSTRVSFDVIGLAAFGHDFDTLQNPDCDIASNYHKIFDVGDGKKRETARAMTMIIPYWLLKFLIGRRHGWVVEAVQVVRGACREAIRNGKARLEKASDESGFDILSVALKSGAFTDCEIEDQLMTFLAAGHETTAASLTCSLHALSQHPEVQDRLRKEIREHLVSSELETVFADMIDNLPYLHAVCMESLRFYPTILQTTRISKTETQLAGRVVPKNTIAESSNWGLHRMKSLWGEDAEIFNPDRWMAPGQHNRGGAKDNYSFNTFMQGPRNCIGQGFAKSELATLLTALVGRYDFRPVEGQEVVMTTSLSLKPLNGCKLHVRRVGGW